MNKNTLYLISKLAALFCVSALNIMANTNIIFNIISILAFCCLFLANFLTTMLKKNRIITIVIIIIGVLGCFYMGIENYLPVAVFLVLELIDMLTDGNMFYQISAVSVLIFLFICGKIFVNVILTLTMLIFFVFIRIVIIRLDYFRENVNSLRTEIAQSKKKLSALNSYTKVLREMTVMEERNRFASKIHDELGHSISGSIILLEGARLNMQKNPEQAEKSIAIATENLRNGVDNIRLSLREERPDKHSLGLSEINEKLEHFKLTYNIDTKLITDGDMNKISVGVWICLQDNLTEALTNTIKHSCANEFIVRISVHNKIIRAEFRDISTVQNNSDGFIKKGIGLETIEERTISCGGKCLFQKHHNGFSVTCIFMI